MTDYHRVYREHPLRYEELVAAEDVDGTLSAALGRLCELAGARVAEAGAGTGRITRLLLNAGVAHVAATEIEPAMLEVAKRELASYGSRWDCQVADARSLPIGNDSADLAIAGWVFGHFRSWMPDCWRDEVGAAVGELERVTRPGGTVVIVETLGTGSEHPSPSRDLAEYYQWLEEVRGFERQTIRTDYLFDSVDDAARITGFFFGEAFAARVREHGWRRVPECTGVWARTL